MADNELVVALKTIDPVVVFNGGLDPILEKIAEETRAIPTDISTKDGRQAVASLAYKIARSKTFLDDTGKKLGEDAKKKLDAINADRKKAREFLDALKDEVRAPLTEWEQKDEIRIAEHEAALLGLYFKGSSENSLAELDAARVALDAAFDRSWEEFSQRALEIYRETDALLKTTREKREKYDAEQAELAKLRAEAEQRAKEEAERRQREHEERIKAEAAEKAKREAEEAAAKAAREAEERAAAELAAEKAKEEKARQEAAAAEERAKKAEADRIAAAEQAEKDRIAAAEKAESDRIAAAEKAKRDQDAAVEAERKRAADQKRAEEEAAAKREADHKHRAKINNEALQALAALECVMGEIPAKAIVIAIAEGKIPHVKISY